MWNNRCDSYPGVEFEYKGKKYHASFLYFSEWNEEGLEVIPTDEAKKNIQPKDSTNKVVVKNYQKGFWKNTIEVNGETVVVKGWGVGKHFVVWGGIMFLILLLLISIYLIRRHRSRLKEEEWRKMVREARKHSS